MSQKSISKKRQLTSHLAIETLTEDQKLFFLSVAIFYIGFLVLDWHLTIVVTIAALTIFYFIDVCISLYLTTVALVRRDEIKATPDLIEARGDNWPKYTILCPLYQEENVIETFVRSIEKLDYPRERLEVLLLLEQDDEKTIQKARSLNLPDYFKLVILPDSQPKTKPKACNVGLSMATGQFLVIYDAEDRPDPDQLKKAVVAFSITGPRTGCVQAKLNFYNRTQNTLTQLFTIEYSLWFDLILPGLQSINAPIPLGGTSNHFPVKFLRRLDGWDPYNVTEDCDLGVRVKKQGYRTVILDSTTWEEANSQLFFNWFRQRSRWFKGYLQTFLVHTRQPLHLIRQIGLKNFFFLMVVIGFRPFSNLINPLLWILTIGYFAFRSQTGTLIESFFPTSVLYFGVLCLFIGNFLYVYYYLIGSSVRRYDDNVKYGLLVPFYWMLMSIASWYGFVQLLYKPHYWEKTKHGLMKLEAKNV